MSAHHHAETLADSARMLVVRSMLKLAGPPENGPEGRPAYDTLLSKLPAAQGVTYEPAVVGGVPGWWCRPEARDGGVLLHLHGGAYVIGSAWAYRHFVGQIARRARASAFVADYALAPERPFPAAFHDAVAVYRALAAGKERTAIVGDSAGGGLALALMSHIAHDPDLSRGRQPCGGALMSPWTDLSLSGESIAARAARDPLLSRSTLADAAKSYLGDVPATERRASPLFGDLSGLPPLLIHVGADEILLDDSLRMARRVEDADGSVEVHEWDGMIHVFPSAFSDLSAAAEALDGIGAFLAASLTGPLPPA